MRKPIMHTQTIRKFAACAVAAALAGTAGAHPTLENKAAPAGASYKATFKIGHGCGGSPTRQIAVDIPAGVRGARPMPKAGWTLEVLREKLAQPYTSHGRTTTEEVVRVTWTARTKDDMLASAHYDEFVLVAQAPDQAGPIYWPLRQACEEGRADWVEIPKPGQKLSDLKAPAAVLEVLPAGANAEHNH
jgi:periplasmic copper chaperone A